MWDYILHTEWVHFVLYIGMIAIIGGMPAPTKDSGLMYQWAFTSLNMFAANFVRATSTKVEKSPNFQEALNIQQANVGQEPTPVVQPEVMSPPQTASGKP